MNNSKEKESGLYKQSSPGRKVDEAKAVSEKLSDEKLDQALADTFPASDPLPWTSDVRKANSERKTVKEAERKTSQKTRKKS